jgi:hypothetical protein
MLKQQLDLRESRGSCPDLQKGIAAKKGRRVSEKYPVGSLKLLKSGLQDAAKDLFDLRHKSIRRNS